MAKRVWERPRVDGQMFEANEYVAACITGTIQCVYPGKSDAKGDNGVYDDYNGNESGWWYVDGKPHGLCGNDATISFNDNTGTGYEFINGVKQLDRPIYHITGYNATPGTYYGVTWSSDDNAQGTGTYIHKGRLIITNIDNAHPNHS